MDFYKMAAELHERLRQLFPDGIYTKWEDTDEGFTLKVKNYNDHAVFFTPELRRN